MGEITGNRPVGGMQVGSQNDNVQNQDGGPVAKGIGLFKKIWLHITGKVESAHSKQLNNLRAQVGQRFDKKGLQDLDNILSHRGWKGPGATKLMTSTEINKLIGSLEVRGMYEKRCGTLYEKVTSDPATLLKNPALLSLVEKMANKGSEPDDRLTLAFIKDMQAFRDGPGDPESLIALTDPKKGWLTEPPHGKLRGDVDSLRDDLRDAVHSGDQERIAEAKEALLEVLERFEAGAFETLMMGISWGDPDIRRDFVAIVDGMALQELKNEGFEKQLTNLRLA